ncbi:MAG: GTPase Era [Deltaproteobacteria bacterium]|nr:GTPase Era [Deltaproteobacteria bacterium]
MVIEKPFKSGFIAIIGRPNVGKSTLMNAILGEKLSIISDRPQTTRNKILGVKNVEGGQLIFLDTPGIHKGKYLMDRLMVKEALSSIEGTDLILAVVDAARPFTEEDEMVLESVKEARPPAFLIINKVDLIKKDLLLPQIARYSSSYNFREIVPLSAATGEGTEELIRMIKNALPEGPMYFPEDTLTDKPMRFVAAEIIREKAINLTREEIPYSIAVMVEEFKEKENLVSITATIYVERDSQKGIIIGKGGNMLKRIGTEARKEIEGVLGCKVYLELWVKVRKEWRKDPSFLKELGIE